MGAAGNGWEEEWSPGRWQGELGEYSGEVKVAGHRVLGTPGFTVLKIRARG